MAQIPKAEGAAPAVLEDVIEVSSPGLEGVMVEIRRDPHNPPPPEDEAAAISEAVEMLRTAIAEAGGDASAEITVEETVTLSVQQELPVEEVQHVKEFVRATDLVGYPPPIREGGPMAELTHETQVQHQPPTAVQGQARVQSQVQGQAAPQRHVQGHAAVQTQQPVSAVLARDEPTVLEMSPEPQETDLLNETLELHDDLKEPSVLDDCCAPCQLNHYPRLPADAPYGQRMFRACLCPPHGPIGNALTGILVAAMVWGVSLAVFRQEAFPGTEIFAVLSLLTTALAGGYVFKIFQLPPLLGMLLVGLAWRNANVSDIVNMGSQISDRTSFIFRNAALAVIILRAGFALNPEALQRSWPILLRLSLIPCTLEALAWSATANLILELPWIWAFLLGSVISSSSSAIVIPAMLRFQRIGLGVDKGIPTITMAATTIDNILVLSLFGLLHGIAFSEGSISKSLAEVPAQIAVGIGFGLVWGLLMRYFPSPDLKKGYVLTGRIVLLLGGGLIAIFGGYHLHYAGSGPLACLILAFIASVSWKEKSGWGKTRPNPVAEVLNGLWVFLEPLLFALIGSEIVLKDLSGRIIGYGVLCMAISLAVRMIASLISVIGAELNLREAFFIALAWLPKATVQAAIGPVIWETARRMKAGPELEDFGHAVLSLAAMSILITAPIGALAIKFLGPSLLNKTTKKSTEEEILEGKRVGESVNDTLL